MNNLEINDIFSLVEVPDNSVYVFVLIVFISLLCIGIFIRFLYLKLKLDRKKKKILKYINILKNCDYNNARDTSYKIEYYTQALVETDVEKELLGEILEDISMYKYQNNISKISQETQEHLNFLLNMIEKKHV